MFICVNNRKRQDTEEIHVPPMYLVPLYCSRNLQW